MTGHRHATPFVHAALIFILSLAWAGPPVQAKVERFKYSSGGNYLIVEFLDDDLVHFELSGLGPGPDAAAPVFVTRQVLKTDYAGPTYFIQSGAGGSVGETPALRVAVDTTTLCATITDKIRGLDLTTLCPRNLNQAWKGLAIAPGAMQHVYGLGEQFVDAGSMDGDWTGRKRTPGDNYGNQMIGFGGGFYGNVQIPVMYAVGPDNANYALFLDQVYKTEWDFTGSPWLVETWGDQIRWYVMAGPDLPDLRRDYLELTGFPPVPPRKMFGLWISEYGFDNWSEMDGKLATLRAEGFPVDGFVLDLQWFGGITSNSDNTAMGRVSFDTTHFPDPAAKLAALRDNEGIGIMLIEESYIGRGLAEHQDLKDRGFLIRSGCETCDPVYLDNASDKNNGNWWGKGGMIDWTLDVAGDYWHDLKRRPLIAMGVVGHWIDLGEPEMYDAEISTDPADWTHGVLPGKHSHADYHNMYNLKWAESVARGYARNTNAERPFMMARSGSAGIQRFGAAMWSGDIGSNLRNLAAHLNAQMHMSFSGVDYFGSDIGGFHRGALGGDDLNEMYTQWFACGMMLEIPGRPHTENLCNCKETSPDRIGDKASNLANARERYALGPYLYSLAHRAFLAGDPVAPPLAFYYQNDLNVRERGGEKLLGRDLLVVAVASANAGPQDVYLPAGDWVDYYSNRWLKSSGRVFPNQPTRRDNLFRLPMYARAGALIPRMHVDGKTMNALGKRTDGSTRDELVVRVYASAAPTSFTLYEDDGATTAYRSGGVRSTLLSQQLDAAAQEERVMIGEAAGTYDGAPTSRNNIVELVADGLQATAVILNGAALAKRPDRASFEAATSGWLNAGANLILAKTGPMDVATGKNFTFSLEPSPEGVSQRFECRNGETAWGQSVYVVGDIPALGNWQPALAVKLNPDGPYPAWTATVTDLPPAATVRWKCIKRPEAAAGPVVWQPGTNNVFTTAASGHGGITTGDFAGGSVSHEFVCDNGATVWGQSVYVVGSVAVLGLWDPAKAVKLSPTAYPRWTGTVANLPPNALVEWKCIKRPEGAAGPVTWESDPNNVFTSVAGGFGGAVHGSF